METAPRSAGNMGLASALTALNVVVASGFSIAGLMKPELVLPTGATPTDASAIFAMYAAARTIPLALITIVALYNGSASTLFVLGLLAGIIQLVDAAVGLCQHDIGKTVGPLFLAILQAYAVAIFWKASKATSS
jgi:acid phosphatase family membrane protein YuiD